MSRTAGRTVLGACAAALALQACAADAPATLPTDCDPPEQQQLQQGGHLLGGQPPPVPYSSTPPTSGWHGSGRGVVPGAYGDPVSEPDQVLWLERGGVVVAYDPTLPDEVVAELHLLPGRVEGLVVTPYAAEMPTPIALTAWGVLQRCESVSVDVARAFHDEFSSDEEH